ncbi:MAG: formylglycine-generating enzyme family protein [Alphaproteobacteria bacterium]|nr:formylglycine-generating enzyme family protein [Alphaproteobacteria bacterium]MBM3627127.1 formylglycine-generating enzyme family protein [Alphaproteobacteria bacterium]
MNDACRRGRRPVAAAIALALLAAAGMAGAQQAPATWPEENWNPQPLADDLVLPLPCGGAMAWRAVPTPVAQGAMADRPALMGQADPQTDYVEYLRQGFIAGPFPGPAGQPPRFYLAKYEISRDQWSAVMSETCPALPSQGGRVAKTEVGWVDAVNFTARLTAYLSRNAVQKLPRRDEAVAYVRLPSEDEWEFAARGGAAVGELEFSARTYPMEGGMQRHAWFQGPRSAAGQPRPIGARAANPLGLHDVYGNAAEWTLEPFRLNKIGRYHGQAGGGVVRGGDFMTPDSALRSSLRVELPPFDMRTGEPLRLRNVGLRPALGLVVTTADARVPEFRAAFDAEAQSRSTAADDPQRLLQVLHDEATDPTVRQGLARVQATLRAESRARADQEAETIRAQITFAAAMARQVLLAEGNSEVLRISGDVMGLIDNAHAKRVGELLRNKHKEMNNGIPPLLDAYLALVQRIGRGAAGARLADQARVVVEEQRAQNFLSMAALAQLAVRHAGAAAEGRLPTRERAQAEIIEAGRSAAPPTQPTPPAAPSPPPSQAPARPGRGSPPR